MRKKMSVCIIASSLLAGFAVDSIAAEKKDNQWLWPDGVKKIKYLSGADNTEQPALFYKPEKKGPLPLLVALHTWSAGYLQPETGYAKWCVDKGWVFIHPDFRGSNKKPSATGSELVVKDIISAVEYAKKNADIDTDRIYLIGGSGGGYASLLMAGRAPEIWAGVSAWVPIFDLKAWHEETKKAKRGYFKNIEDSCGGAPGASPAVDEQYKLRSACTYIQNAKNVHLDINTGIHDGHTGSVPVSHSLNAFNALAKEQDKIQDSDIKFMTDNQGVPETLNQKISDPLYGKNTPLFRKISGNARVTVFEGGHNTLTEAGLTWLEHQKKSQPPVWDVKKTNTKVKFTEKDINTGK